MASSASPRIPYTKGKGPSGWLERLAKLVLVGTALVTGAPVFARLDAGAAGQSPSIILKKSSPAALRGNREAVRSAAKAISRLGPRSFKSAKAMRSQIRAEAERGSSSAATAYGMMLQHGIGGPARPKEAPAWFSRGSARGNASASKNGAMTYALGWGVRRNNGRAMQMLARVPVHQRARLMLQISATLLDTRVKEPKPSMMWLQHAVALNTGETSRAIEIADRLAGINPEAEREIQLWLAPLVAKGNATAAMLLARRMEAGGGTRERKEAAQLYLAAAGKNVEGAYEALGRMLEGDVETDSMSLALIEESASRGSTGARVALANYYLFRSTGTQDFRQRGLDYLRQAARDGNSDAQYRLGLMLLMDGDTHAQKAMARAYLVLSAKGGNIPAGIAIAQLGTMPLQQAQEMAGLKTE